MTRKRKSGDEFPVVSTSSTTGPLPEPVEGSSGDSCLTFLRSQIVTLEPPSDKNHPSAGTGKHRKFLPYVLTEHGALMLATVLKSDKAIYASIFVVRAFIQLREFLEVNKELAKKIAEMESKYDEQFTILFAAVRELIHRKKEKLNPVGFRIPGNSS